MTAEIINMIEYMNSKGIFHRDLKPSNLLLDEHYHLKLIDFGTAKVIENNTNNSGRKSSMCIEIEENNQEDDIFSVVREDHKKGTLVGTEDYIAPEVLNSEP